VSETRWIFNTDCSSLSARLFHFQASPIKPEKCDCRLKLAAATSSWQKISKVSLVVSQDFPCRVVFPHDAQRLSRKSKGSRSLSAQHRRAFAQRAHTQTGKQNCTQATPKALDTHLSWDQRKLNPQVGI